MDNLNLNVHITGVQTNEDGTVELIDVQGSGEAALGFADTVTEEDGREAHEGVAMIYGEWNANSLISLLEHLREGLGDDMLAAAIMKFLARKAAQQIAEAMGPQAAAEEEDEP